VDVLRLTDSAVDGTDCAGHFYEGGSKRGAETFFGHLEKIEAQMRDADLRGFASLP
jgi:hypothetical protein